MDDLAPPPAPPAEAGDVEESRIPLRLYALKHGDTFLVADEHGDVLGGGDGLFRNDTRLLSCFRLLIGGHAPALLSAAVTQDNVFFTANATNRPLPPTGGRETPRGVIHVERRRFLWEDRLYERITCTNYGRDEAIVPLSVVYGADFRDMFEVRGEVRPRRGVVAPPRAEGRSVAFAYEGLDGVTRASVISFSEPPARLNGGRADWMLAFQGEQRQEIYLEVGPEPAPAPSRERYRAAAARARTAMRARHRAGPALRSSGRLFNDWLDKSRADLALLTTDLPTGPYPYAGIPWFSTAFGRDAIVTAFQTLWLQPALARGVLSFLAAHQAVEKSAFHDSAPGKIMHETRKGEMTALGELPFGRYYGGVDTTPLFVKLAGAYFRRTGDEAFLDALWPALQGALTWLEGFEGEGLVTYARAAETGLANQGWKDSEDSVFHEDGAFPEGPIALVEVQGYAFAAYREMAGLASRRGEPAAAERWLARAERLRQAVERRFWMEDRQAYAIALDGAGAPCRVLSSNPGHLLFSGLPSPERAALVTRRLLTGPFDTGWGLRTLATGEARYNPMSYHNGSVWPHDTALCAAGMARYGERDGVMRLLGRLFETAVHFEMRLPELFCGFTRARGEGPVAYPVACIPQAWSAGAVFMMLQAGLGVTVDGLEGRVRVRAPRLPPGVDRLAVEGLEVAGRRGDLVFQRDGERVAVTAGRGCGFPVAIDG